MNGSCVRACGAVLFVLLAFSCLAQQVQTFVRFEEKKTTQPVTSGIDPAALHIRDDGRPAKSIDGLTSAAEVPAKYVVLFDESGSGSRSATMHALRAAVPTLLASVMQTPRDSVAIVDFNDEYYLDVPFTSDLSGIARKLKDKEEYRGGTALFDAIEAACRKLFGIDKGASERRVVIIMSDGRDNSSRSNLRDATKWAQDSGAMVFAITVEDSTQSDSKNLVQLAEATGGRAFGGIKAKQLNDFVSYFQRILAAEFVVTYTPAATPNSGKRRRFEVTGPPNVVAIAPQWVTAP